MADPFKFSYPKELFNLIYPDTQAFFRTIPFQQINYQRGDDYSLAHEMNHATMAGRYGENTFDKMYGDFENQYGYERNPFEILANDAGYRETAPTPLARLEASRDWNNKLRFAENALAKYGRK